MLQDLVDILDDTLPINLHRLIGHVTQSNMIHGSFLREVDLLSCKHFISQLLHASFFCQLDEQREGVFSDEVLGEVEEDLGFVGCVLEGSGELLKAVRVLFEEFFQDNVAAQGGVMLLELLPCLEVTGLGETRHCRCISDASFVIVRFVGRMGTGSCEEIQAM